eukprot:Pgem_evm1s13917
MKIKLVLLGVSFTPAAFAAPSPDHTPNQYQDHTPNQYQDHTSTSEIAASSPDHTPNQYQDHTSTSEINYINREGNRFLFPSALRPLNSNNPNAFLSREDSPPQVQPVIRPESDQEHPTLGEVPHPLEHSERFVEDVSLEQSPYTPYSSQYPFEERLPPIAQTALRLAHLGDFFGIGFGPRVRQGEFLRELERHEELERQQIERENELEQQQREAEQRAAHERFMANQFFPYDGEVEIRTDRLPVVLWHGMGDDYLMGGYAQQLSNELGVFVYSVMIGNPNDDAKNGIFVNANRQVAEACEKIKVNPYLAGGFNAVGFSQGGQFLRGVIERCDFSPGSHKVKNLITIGSQHQGVAKAPTDSAVAAYLISWGVYTSYAQQNLAQANYWHAKDDEEGYIKYNTFLADINNAKPVKNSVYKDRLTSLSKFVMVKFMDDEMVTPPASSHFEFYRPELPASQEILPLRQSPIYLEDHIGLKVLDEQNKLEFITIQ